jgi:glycolate oxidase FAD binding subunit
MPRQIRPTTFEAAALALSGAAAGNESVRVLGGASKRSWGRPVREPDVEIRTSRLDGLVEHNQGDLTAVLQAGVPLARAQETFAAAGQMLAIDPWLGSQREATIGGVIATADSGPLRHRYGAPRDLVVGITVALSDGTVARAGGKVIKNVAGYDLAKLFCGSFGTLGMILEVNVRLHPLAAQTATALGVSPDAERLAAAASGLAGAPLELEALDVAWRSGRGGLLAQCGGVAAVKRADGVAGLMRELGLERVEVTARDAELWARQRAGQRSAAAALVRVSARPSQLGAVLSAAERCGGTVVGRAALGLSFVELDPGLVPQLIDLLPARAGAVLGDGPDELRERIDVWGAARSPESAVELMRRVKARFDPAGACNPGVFVGGI